MSSQTSRENYTSPIAIFTEEVDSSTMDTITGTFKLILLVSSQKNNKYIPITIT